MSEHQPYFDDLAAFRREHQRRYTSEELAAIIERNYGSTVARVDFGADNPILLQLYWENQPEPVIYTPEGDVFRPLE